MAVAIGVAATVIELAILAIFQTVVFTKVVLDQTNSFAAAADTIGLRPHAKELIAADLSERTRVVSACIGFCS